jgi:hypothetical protein
VALIDQVRRAKFHPNKNFTAPTISAVTHYITLMDQLKIARLRRPSPLLACKKCLKRCSDGDRIRVTLKRELKQRRPDKKKAPRLVWTSCFGICPKRAVVLASGHSLRGNEFVLVSRRGEVEQALAKLLPPV